jgi:hypothetical protein
MVKVTGAAQIPCPTSPAIVPAAVNGAAGTADRNFFSPPNEGEETPLGIAEYPLHASLRAESGKRVCIRQPATFTCFWHPHIMPNFPIRSTRMEPRETRRGIDLAPRNRPHEFTMTHIKFHCLILSSSVSTQFQARGITDPLRGT